MQDAFRVLEQTSRTFFVPIQRLPDPLRLAVASAYLCMRAIDEIEDHPRLPAHVKGRLLAEVSLHLQGAASEGSLESFVAAFGEHAAELPEVTLRLHEWALLAPPTIQARVWDAIASMADRMGYWAELGFDVRSEEDLDRYTYGVAGAVGILLCDLWAWHDGTTTHRGDAIGFGRGLQAVNIARNRADDFAHGVDFYPRGWTDAQMWAYARRHLSIADRYTAALPKGPIREFCAIPLALAWATVAALEQGREKLTRGEVNEVVAKALLA
ncbi:MAG: phytoene/squalene synthase family protein [Planctomycetes bacterium]|nr:phytoene/squalene synthase family protein [Planctomycetota bacterium]MCC7170811.1 phytoene/squalene synthase family protein [Planctomycetota bacterium]